MRMGVRRWLIALVSAAALAASAAVAAPAGAFVYWANQSGGSGTTIGRAETDGTGATQDFITGVSAPIGVAIDGAHIYWANEKTNSIGRANLDGSVPNQSFITGAHRASE